MRPLSQDRGGNVGAEGGPLIVVISPQNPFLVLAGVNHGKDYIGLAEIRVHSLPPIANDDAVEAASSKFGNRPALTAG